MLLCISFSLVGYRTGYGQQGTTHLVGYLRTFAPIATAHPYSARKFKFPVMHRARALSIKMNNDRADGHCYSFAWI